MKSLDFKTIALSLVNRHVASIEVVLKDIYNKGKEAGRLEDWYTAQDSDPNWYESHGGEDGEK